MSHWAATDWVLFFAAAGPFAALLAANLVMVIKAWRDRATIAATTNTQLAAIATKVDAPVTVPPTVSVTTTTGSAATVATVPPTTPPTP